MYMQVVCHSSWFGENTNVVTFVVSTINVMTLEDELKMSKITDPCHRSMLNTIFTGAWLSERFGAILKPFGISQQQFNVLRILRGQKGQPVNLFAIQERMVHRSSNATRLVEKLRLKGLVERCICAQDRRCIEITITKAGLKLLDDIDPKVQEHHLAVGKNLSEKEANTLGRLLDKLRG